MFSAIFCLVAFATCVLSQHDPTLNITTSAKLDVFNDFNVNVSNTNRIDEGIDSNQTLISPRIIQPSDTQPYQRKFLLGDDLSNATQNLTFQDDFKPSRPVEPYYEYNQFPVKPAHPEPKFFDNIDKYLEPNPGINRNAWSASPNFVTAEPPWTNRVKFPTSRPYNFVTGQGKVEPTNFPSITTEGFNFNKKIGVSKPGELSYEQNDNSRPMQKTFYDYNLLEKPFGEEGYHPTYGYNGYEGGYGGYPGYGGYGYGHQEIVTPHRDYGHGGYGLEQGGGGSSKSPWKKIIKFLAAAIPIGLLISALTPTMITVQSASGGTGSGRDSAKYRTDEKLQEFSKRLATSFQYFDKLKDEGCEQKVLCELLVSASLSKNAEEHVKILLDNFVKQEDLKSKKDDLLKVFDAVKSQDCSPIVCSSLKNPT